MNDAQAAPAAASTGAAAMTKDEILAAGRPRVVVVDVPGWGAVKLRELSIDDVGALKDDDGAASTRLVAASVMNGDGGPMFTVAEIASLAAGRAKPTMAALVAEIEKLNGLSDAAAKAIAKN